MSKYAVVDVETTGFGKTDRIVEIAVVVVDVSTGQIVDEFDTLLNPQRDIGATHVHGITASMVESAPTFPEVAGALARVLGGNILVSHNLAFDRRFLLQEFSRAGIGIEPGEGICTLMLSGEKLQVACKRHGILMDHHHRALSDARAASALLVKLEFSGVTTPLAIHADLEPGIPRTLRRDSISGEHMPIIPSRFRVRYPSSEELAMSYLNVLDAYLDDLVLTDLERNSLDELAAHYDFAPERRQELHDSYVQALVAAARRDGVISDSENQIISAITHALGVDPSIIPPVTEIAKVSGLDGMRMCFTGKATIAGIVMERDKLEAIAANHGIQPVSSVTKNCDVLVAADPASTSGKAQKARQYGIPIMSIQEFMEAIDSADGER